MLHPACCVNDKFGDYKSVSAGSEERRGKAQLQQPGSVERCSPVNLVCVENTQGRKKRFEINGGRRNRRDRIGVGIVPQLDTSRVYV